MAELLLLDPLRVQDALVFKSLQLELLSGPLQREEILQFAELRVTESLS